jgi:predicted AlkP superfamily pyrophosphatase or phosphodiesterase
MLFICFSQSLMPSFGQSLAQSSSGSPTTPKLVLEIVSDQMSFEYLYRYKDKLSSGGFRYLIDHGANFVNCRYRQAATQTAPGHSIIATGAYPWSTGIVGNQWLDRRRGKEVYACGEDGLTMVGGTGPCGGTKNLLGSTIGDELRLATNGRAKVFSLSLKDCAAMLLAGRIANGAFWFDTRSGAFVSTSQYGRELPSWVKSFNDKRYADSYFGKSWERLLPETQYAASVRDDYPYEKAMVGGGRQFPHVITGGVGGPGESYYQSFQMTPFANQMLCELAKDAIESEHLGQHTDPDMLAISFSAQDFVGHAFGPYSQEMEDLVLRLDKTLAELFQYVDHKVGLDKCLIVVSADHGVCPIPEFLKEKGMEAGRIDPKAFQTLVNATLVSRLGQDDWIEAFIPPNLYLNLDAIDRKKRFQPDVEALTAKIAHSVAGVGEVYTAAQFYANQLPAGPHAKAVKSNYFWGRSGELIVLAKPNYVFTSESSGTGHGSPYSYDSQVPMIFSGPGIATGTFSRSSSPADIAPTIAAILQISQPSLVEGRVLNEAMSEEYGPKRSGNYASNDRKAL